MGRQFQSALFCLGLALWCSLPRPANAQARLDGIGSQGLTVRTVLGIISYARWPTAPKLYRMCVVGDAEALRGLGEQTLEVAGREVSVTALAFEHDRWGSECDIVYFGAMPRKQRLALLKQVQVGDVLTIGQGEESCSDGVMICLDIGEQKALLHANLDAIGRSRVRINASVLQLSHQRLVQP